MSYETRYHLKKPLLIYALALCFMAAPIGNIVASMISFGVYHWYTPGAFTRFVANISAADWCWLSLTFFAGCVLLVQRKWTWLSAIAALVVASAVNFRYSMEFSAQLAHGKYFFPVLFMMSNVGIVAILYHFRFPYLDRREAWWGVYPRYRCNIPATGEAGFSGTFTNISRRGAFVEGAHGASLEVGKTYTFSFGAVTGIKAEVVRTTKNGFGIEFNPTRGQSNAIRQVIRELAVPPIGETVVG